MEEKITVMMTADYLFDFTLYHTYSKFAGFLSNVLGMAIAFMGIIMMVMGKIHGVQFAFYLIASVVFVAYTPLLLKMRAKKQVQVIDEYRFLNEYTFGEEGIRMVCNEKESFYPWQNIQKVVKTPKTIGYYDDADHALIIPKKDFGDRFVSIMTMTLKNVKPGCVHLK